MNIKFALCKCPAPRNSDSPTRGARETGLTHRFTKRLGRPDINVQLKGSMMNPNIALPAGKDSQRCHSCGPWGHDNRLVRTPVHLCSPWRIFLEFSTQSINGAMKCTISRQGGSASSALLHHDVYVLYVPSLLRHVSLIPCA